MYRELKRAADAWVERTHELWFIAWAVILAALLVFVLRYEGIAL